MFCKILSYSPLFVCFVNFFKIKFACNIYAFYIFAFSRYFHPKQLVLPERSRQSERFGQFSHYLTRKIKTSKSIVIIDYIYIYLLMIWRFGL